MQSSHLNLIEFAPASSPHPKKKTPFGPGGFDGRSAERLSENFLEIELGFSSQVFVWDYPLGRVRSSNRSNLISAGF